MEFVGFMNKWYNLPLTFPSFPGKLGKLRKKLLFKTNEKLVQMWHKVINLENICCGNTLSLKDKIIKNNYLAVVIPIILFFFSQTKEILKCFMQMAVIPLLRYTWSEKKKKTAINKNS